MVRLRLCGGLTLEADGHRLPDTMLGGRQGRLVLAYLVCERHRTVPRDELAELLWGDNLPSSWTASLSAVVSKLRRLLSEAGLDGAATLASAFGSYRLHLPDDAWVDWEIALAGAADADRAIQAGDAHGAAAAAEQVQQIARRGFLDDDCSWVDRQREHLHDLHVRVAQIAAEAHMLLGEQSSAVVAAREAVELDPLREASVRLLMRALASAGERGEALRVWERCRVLLAEELGSDPDRETESVYLSILGDANRPAKGRLPTGVVTFLLTDIVESTGLWERDSAAMDIALARHDRLVATVVESNGGVLLKQKLEGDATVSVFPRASTGAVAALTLRTAMAVEPWPAGAVPTVRMALHTGEAIERDGDYFGPALNRAARLRGLAGAGQIVVSHAVAEVISDHLPDDAVLRSLGERRLRGLSRAEHVFELVTADELSAGGTELDMNDGDDDVRFEQPPLPAMLAASGPFVGRQDELDRLATDWATATTGTARATFLAGEPGVGKSRIASEWARQVHERGAVVAYGRCDEELGAPYQPFAEALRSLVPHLGATRLGDVRGIEELSRLVPELADLVPDLPPPAQGDPDTERYLLFDALARLFTSVSEELPVLIVADDLHWAGKPTLLLLRHLLRSCDGSRIQIVGTYRTTDLSRTHPLAGVLADLHRDGTAERVSLSGLGSDDVNDYLSASGYDDVHLGAELSRVTSGNPFFLIEVLRHVEESGGVWDPSTLPQGVREAVDRRLAHLSDMTGEALLVGAVAGSQFTLDLIEQVVGHDLVDAMDEALQAGLVVEESGGQFRFNHALVRQSLLAELASVKRIRLHQRIAAALESDHSVPDDSRLAELAHHYFECAFAGGAGKAVDYSRRAGEQAMARLAYEEAADLYDRALQASDVTGSGCSDDDKAKLLLARCEALLAAGDPTGAGALVEQLQRAARGSAQLSAWATCVDAQLAVLVHPELLEVTAREVGAAAQKFAEIDDAEGEANAHTVRASCLARLGRIADCEAALDRALTAGRRAGNPRRVNAVLAGAPVAALRGPSPVARATGRCLDVVRVLRITTASPAVEATALRCQAVLEALRGRTDAARTMLASARGSLESLGHTHGLLETDVFAGMVELLAGEPGNAQVPLRRAYDGFVARGVGVDAAQAAALLARSALAEGRMDEALALTEQSEQLAGVDLQAAIAWRSARAEALARQGKTAEALEAATAAAALADPTDALLDQADAHLSLSTVLRAAGNDADADKEAHHAIELYRRKGATARVDAVQATVPLAGEQATTTEKRTRRRRVVPNKAILAQTRGSGRWQEGSFDEWQDAVAEDYVEIDHLMHARSDREAYVRTLRIYAVMDGFNRSVEPIAALGERHCLSRVTLRAEGTPVGRERIGPTGAAVIDFVEVARCDAAGRLVLCERFPEAEMNLAIGRLLEMHAEDELPADLRVGRQRIAGLVTSRASFVWHEDAVIVDNRTAGLGTVRGRDAIREAARALHDVAGQVSRRVTDLLALAQDVLLIEVVTEGLTDSGEVFELPMLTIGEFDAEGRQRRVEWFELEQIDDALVRFDELSGTAASGVRRVTPNVASALLRKGRMDEALLDVSTLLADDFVKVDHRMQVSMDAAGVVDTMRQMSSGERAYLENTPIATMGDLHCISRAVWRLDEPAGRQTGAGPAEVEFLQVFSVDAGGLVHRIEQFDPDQLHLALARVTELYAEVELPADKRTWRYRAASMLRNQNTQWHDDAVLVDHRPAGLGTLVGRQAIAGAADALRDVAGADARRRIVDVLAFSDGLSLFELVTEGSVTPGGPFELSVLALSELTDDALCIRQDWYDLEQIEDALGRFEMLAASHHLGP